MNGAFAARILNRKDTIYKDELRLDYVEQMSPIPIDALFGKPPKYCLL